MIVEDFHVTASREVETNGFARFADNFLADWNPRFSGAYLQEHRATPPVRISGGFDVRHPPYRFEAEMIRVKLAEKFARHSPCLSLVSAC